MSAIKSASYCLLFIVFVLFCFIPMILDAVVKGSETVVSVEPAVTFPAAAADNKMLAFGWFKNGFTLEDVTTTCTFASIFPVGGSVNLNGGKLYLESDLHFANSSTLQSFGKIYGGVNSNILEFDANLTDFYDQANLGLLQDINLVTNSDVTLTGSLRFLGDCTFNGKGRRIFFNPGSSVTVGVNSTLHVKDATLVGITSEKLRCLNNSSKIILDNTDIILDGSYTCSVGLFEILNSVEVVGSYTFFYDGTYTLSINPYSSLNIGQGTCIYFGNEAGTNQQDLVWFADTTAKLNFHNSAITIGPAGLLLRRGTMEIRGRVDVDINSTNTSNGLIMGNGTDAGNVSIVCHPASLLNFDNGHLTFNMTNQSAVQSLSTYTKLVRGPSNVFYIQNDILYADVTIVVDPDSALLVAPGKQVLYNNSKISMDPVKFIIKGSRYNTYTSLLDGNDWVFIQEGILPLYFLVQNSGNSFDGNGSVSGQIILADSSAELTLNLDGQFLNHITLGGSKLILNGDTELGHSVLIKGAGTVKLDRNDLILGTKDLTWTSTIYWDGNNGAIDMNADISLYSTWTFSGDCVFKGNGNILYIEQDGQINVERGSSLTLKNIKVKKIRGTNIRCLDAAASIWFDHVDAYLNNNFYFNNGFFVIDHCLAIEGGYCFYYQTDQQSLVVRDGHLEIKEDCSLYYNPPVALRNLILLDTKESVLSLDDATLHSTSTGLQLTKGTLKIMGQCYVASDAIYKPEGIIFGDGVSLNNNLTLSVLPESTLKLISGHLIYKNLN